jgi:polysaccharide biosynthesis/export protein
MVSYRIRNVYSSISSVLLLSLALPLPTLAQSYRSPSPQLSSPSAEAAVRPAYLLGAGDQIQITVYGYEEYTGARVILPDGTITLPVLGSVPAADRTPDELTRELTARLQPYLVDPVVTVSLNTLRPVVVNVAGEVHRPGPVQLRSLTTVSNTTGDQGSTTRGTVESVPTISAALVEAGGVTSKADIRKLTLRRMLPGGNYTTLTVNLWDALWSDTVPQNLVLQSGDTIFVPLLTEGETLDRRLLSRSTLAPRTVRVRVVGEVNSPGEVEVPPDSTISSAVAIAGGPNRDATLRRVELVRLNENGQITSEEMDLRDLDDDYQVQEGDVIYVPERGRSSFFRVMGEVLSPVNSLFNLLQRLAF